MKIKIEKIIAIGVFILPVVMLLYEFMSYSAPATGMLAWMYTKDVMIPTAVIVVVGLMYAFLAAPVEQRLPLSMIFIGAFLTVWGQLLVNVGYILILVPTCYIIGRWLWKIRD